LLDPAADRVAERAVDRLLKGRPATVARGTYEALLAADVLFAGLQGDDP